VERTVEDLLARHPAPIIRLAEDLLQTGVMARVVQVIDGDTVVVHDGSESIIVRLAGVDSPELGDPSGRGQHAAWCAAMWTREYLMGEIVAVVREPNQNPTDNYGRTVAYLVRQPEGSIANCEIVRAGHARATPEHPSVLAHPLHELEIRARATRRGMWSDREIVSPG
jgi:endonuclease YncB( thermonuclease family)